MKLTARTSTLIPVLISLTLCIIIGCQTAATGNGKTRQWEARYNDRLLRPVTPEELLREVRLEIDLIPARTVGRKIYRPMQPRYITIHSTQNYTGNAYQHSLALKRGALKATKRPGGNRIGYLTWHFTTQDNVAIQHLPCREQGEHADFDGPGNNYSIGIEMCEHRGNDLALTIDRTARLAAYLCHTYKIPVRNVVPHYHWPRRGQNPPNKNCPHFLLENGRPGPTWRWFVGRVEMHLKRIKPGPTPYLG